MKSLRIVFAVLFMHLTYYSVSQSCGQSSYCTVDVTNAVYSNMSCNKLWEPDVRVLWGSVTNPQQDNYCVICIHNDGAQPIDVEVCLNSMAPFCWNVDIAANNCRVVHISTPTSTNVNLGFDSGSGNSYECTSSFCFNCL